jgi:hypothetical protein
MATRYLEFDSTYRNRNLYPQPSQFIVPISESGTVGKFNALDPVSNSSPVLVWNNSFSENSASKFVNFITLSPIPNDIRGEGLVGGTYFQCKIVVPQAQQNKTTSFRQVRNFYVGCNLSIGTLVGGVGTYPPVAPVTLRRIVEYLPINESNAIFVIESPFPDELYGINGFYINNPGTQSTDIQTTIPKVFIPFSNNGWVDVQRIQNFGSGTDNYYINFSLQNTDLSGQTGGELYNVISFDYLTRLATLDKPTPPGIDFNGTIANFVLRKIQPIDTGIIPPKSLLNLNACVYGLSIQINSDILNFSESNVNYKGDFFRIKPSNFQLAPWTKPVNEERSIKDYIYGTGKVISLENGNMVINLGSTASSLDNYYKDAILSIVNTTTKTFLDSAKIISYNGATKKAILSSPLTFVAVDSDWYIRTIILNSDFSITPTRNFCNLLIGGIPFSNYPADYYYEIESWSRENAVPFNYFGNYLPGQQSVCYEIELINLSIPNITLTSGRGGRPIFYPFFYVQFQPVSDQAYNKNMLFSNNPNANKALFRALNSDTSTPLDTPYLKIDGDGMKMNIKFKFTDSFLFTIYHPEGDLVTFDVDEQFSPVEANAASQISACFSFRRIE